MLRLHCICCAVSDFEVLPPGLVTPGTGVCFNAMRTSLDSVAYWFTCWVNTGEVLPR
jgi:hypothetical protein